MPDLQMLLFFQAWASPKHRLWLQPAGFTHSAGQFCTSGSWSYTLAMVARQPIAHSGALLCKVILKIVSWSPVFGSQSLQLNGAWLIWKDASTNPHPCTLPLGSESQAGFFPPRASPPTAEILETKFCPHCLDILPSPTTCHSTVLKWRG